MSRNLTASKVRPYRPKWSTSMHASLQKDIIKVFEKTQLGKHLSDPGVLGKLRDGKSLLPLVDEAYEDVEDHALYLMRDYGVDNPSIMSDLQRFGVYLLQKTVERYESKLDLSVFTAWQAKAVEDARKHVYKRGPERASDFKSANTSNERLSSMSRNLTASDRSNLIRLAASMPKGSEERKTILAGLVKTSATPSWPGADKVYSKLYKVLEKMGADIWAKAVADAKKKRTKPKHPGPTEDMAEIMVALGKGDEETLKALALKYA
jgi:hypothetical protein